jgi:hypothetical protein
MDIWAILQMNQSFISSVENADIAKAYTVKT